jgi:hypothetical protein
MLKEANFTVLSGSETSVKKLSIPKNILGLLNIVGIILAASRFLLKSEIFSNIATYLIMH